MFKDIKTFLDDNRIDYTYDIKDGELICTLPSENNNNKLEIVFDENIYDDITFDKTINFNKINSGKIQIDLKNISTKLITFKLKINYKFFIKTIHKFINNFINIDKLLDELDFFKQSTVGKKYRKQIDLLINEIDKNSITDLLSTTENEKDRIDNILLNNELYLFLVDKMTAKDLMLLITAYISSDRQPKIDQETFNNLVKEAISYDHALENVWRLGMNYDERGLNFDLLDEFFVNSKDSWYLSEYISGINQVNQEKIINMVIKTKDKDFIKQLLNDNFIQSHLDDKYKAFLQDALND
ncbi:MAG: hypothetical protein E7168_03430 [Firmicutes bacterium]|nr:hypothetical protein [Bacillota bacterium]